MASDLSVFRADSISAVYDEKMHLPNLAFAHPAGLACSTLLGLVFLAPFAFSQEEEAADHVATRAPDTKRLLWSFELKAPSYGSGAAADIDGDGKLEVVFGTYFNDEFVYGLKAEDG